MIYGLWNSLSLEQAWNWAIIFTSAHPLLLSPSSWICWAIQTLRSVWGACPARWALCWGKIHTHTHTREGQERGGGWPQSLGLLQRPWWVFIVVSCVAGEFNFFPLTKIKNKRMQWDSCAIEKSHEDLNVETVFRRKKAVNEIWQYLPICNCLSPACKATAS